MAPVAEVLGEVFLELVVVGFESGDLVEGRQPRGVVAAIRLILVEVMERGQPELWQLGGAGRCRLADRAGGRARTETRLLCGRRV